MIQQECIDELVDVVGVGDYVKVIIVCVMNGEFDFEGVLIEWVGLFKDFDESVIQIVIDMCIIFMFGG